MIEFYLKLSIFVGMLIIVDSILLLRSDRICGNNKLQSATSTFEFIWVIVSIIALIKLEFSQWIILVPIYYVSFNAIGWCYGYYISSKLPGVLEGKEKLVVPFWWVLFGMVLAVIYSIGSALALTIS